MPDGFFEGEHPDAREGDLYRYRLDHGEVYPDPASRFQPQGVHGPSQIIDPNRFHWTDSAWTGVRQSEKTYSLFMNFMSERLRHWAVSAPSSNIYPI